MIQDDEGARLIREALSRTKHIPSLRKRAKALGVSDGTLRIWLGAEKVGEPFPPLTDRLREGLRNGRVVRERGRPGGGGLAGNAEFWKRYDAIEASDLPEPIRIHKVDSLAAAIRALAQDKDAAAALERTRVMEMEVSAGMERTRAVASRPAKESPRAERSVGAKRRRA